jgi:hypothetical protein
VFYVTLLESSAQESALSGVETLRPRVHCDPARLEPSRNSAMMGAGATPMLVETVGSVSTHGSARLVLPWVNLLVSEPSGRHCSCNGDHCSIEETVRAVS